MIGIAQYGLIIILSMLLVLHWCVLSKINPYENVWGGKLTSVKKMYKFETAAILITIFFLVVVLVQCKFILIDIPSHFITILLWIMSIFFLANTLGNISSQRKIEKYVFAPLTIALTLFSTILAVVNN